MVLLGTAHATALMGWNQVPAALQFGTSHWWLCRTGVWGSSPASMPPLSIALVGAHYSGLDPMAGHCLSGDSVVSLSLRQVST